MLKMFILLYYCFLQYRRPIRLQRLQLPIVPDEMTAAVSLAEVLRFGEDVVFQVRSKYIKMKLIA